MSSCEEGALGAAAPGPDGVLARAQALTRQRRQDATEVYRQRLLVLESAVQANRLIVNLDKVLAAKAQNGEDVSAPLRVVDESRKQLMASLQSGDSTKTLEVEERVEQMTLTHDPFYLENEEKRREQRRVDVEDRHKAGWMSSPSSRVIQLMKGDRKGVVAVTRAERRSCMSTVAWTFAISGMVIAIAFLVVDFYTAQTRPVLRTSLVAARELELPVVTYCMGFPNIGSFQNRGELGLKGGALFGITQYDNFETAESFGSDEAHEKVFEPVTVGPASCRDRMQSFSPAQMLRENPANSSAGQQTEECFACFRNHNSRPVKLSAAKSLPLGRPPVRVKLVRSQAVTYCFSGVTKYHSPSVRDSLVDVFLANSEALEKRGTLRADVSTVKQALLTVKNPPHYSDDVKVHAEYVEQTVSFLCNVYFFSGFFFPATGDMDIQYRYGDGGTNNPLKRRFLRSGRGPWHEAYYVDGQSSAERLTMAQELASTSSRDASRLERLFVYALDRSFDRDPNINDLAAILSHHVAMTLQFTYSVNHGVPGFAADVSRGQEVIEFDGSTFSDFEVDMGMSTFGKQVTTRRPATSVAEFLTDVFEYAGLFTGVCAYSILVAPARMYLRRPQPARGGR
jgi:hypothetical protein